MLSKLLIQFSVDGWGSVLSLLFGLRPNYVGGCEDNGNLLQKILCIHCLTQCPRNCSRPLPTHTSAGDSWTLTGKSGSVSCGVTAHFFGFWGTKGFVCALQESLKSLLQHHSSKASVLRCSAFIIVQFSHPYMTTGKTKTLTRQTFVDKVMSLLFNMLSRLVIAFLLRNNHLLISWLQSPSAVSLEPPQNKV